LTPYTRICGAPGVSLVNITIFTSSFLVPLGRVALAYLATLVDTPGKGASRRFQDGVVTLDRSPPVMAARMMRGRVGCSDVDPVLQNEGVKVCEEDIRLVPVSSG